MFNKYVKILFLLLMPVVVFAEYSGSKYLSVDLQIAGQGLIKVEQDLQDELEKADTFSSEPFIQYKSCADAKNCSGSWINSELGEQGVLTISSPGLYQVEVYEKDPGFDDVLWSQLVYIPYPSPEIAEELAKQYLPVVIFNEGEQYFPQSLEDILSYNQGVDSIVVSRHRNGNNDDSVFMGEAIKGYMQFNGHKDAWFNFGFGESTCLSGHDLCSPLFLRNSTGAANNTTIYWDSSEEGDSLYLTYYFFYAFDPKTGTLSNPAQAAHAFDRESFTIQFLKRAEGRLTPFEVTYAGHLESQSLKFNGCNNQTACSEPDERGSFNNNAELIGWAGGKTSISWSYINKVGKHPVIYKAKGSHAIFPTYGFYTVEPGELLTEPAGSISNSIKIIPSNLKETQYHSGTTVHLEELKYSALPYLSYSGAWVDVVLTTGPNGAKFPPFIRAPYSNWLSSTNKSFDDCLFDIAHGLTTSVNCLDTQEYFMIGLNENDKEVIDKSRLKGLENYRAITVRTINNEDLDSPEIEGNSEVKLIASDGSLEIVKQTRLDGQYTFFFKPEESVSYHVEAKSNQYGYISCETLDTNAVDLSFNKNSFEEKELNCYVNLTEVIKGDIQGSVRNAISHAPVENATIEVMQNGETGSVIYHTGSSGIYALSVPVGAISLRISAPGYIPATVNVFVVEGEVTTVTELQQIPDEFSGIGTVRGAISNAFNSLGVSGVMLRVRSGVDATTGTVIKGAVTDVNGAYELTLDAGNYTIETSKTGYSSAYFTVVSIGNNITPNQGTSITPLIPEGQVRIILSWGAVPTDLDSHLFTPTIEGSEYHIYYNSPGQESNQPFASLDVDDTDSYGPETITLYQLFAGTYTYSVHNFSESPAITTSTAKVTIYDSTGLLKSYNVPPEGNGDTWNVFTLDGHTGDITPINTIQ